MFEGIILGIIQGVTEWLPVSSEGILTLVSIQFFGKNLANSISMAIFLHLGTFLAALIYFRSDIWRIFKKSHRKILIFLIVSTVVTGILGVPLLYLGIRFFENVLWLAILFIGLFLIVTGVLQLKQPRENTKTSDDLKVVDAVVVGGLQGLASLPGFSRSGLTIFGLLVRRFREEEALRISFLMSLPAVLFGNILILVLAVFFVNSLLPGVVPSITLDMMSISALITSFVVGLFAIHYFLKLARKLNFAWFAIAFGALTLLSLFFV